MITSRLRAGLAVAVAVAGVAWGSTAVQAQTVDTLTPGEMGVYENYLEEGDIVSITCDVDCSDIDAWLYDSYSDELLDSDTLPDDNPIVVAPYSGTFRLEVYMVDCAASFCEIYID